MCPAPAAPAVEEVLASRSFGDLHPRDDVARQSANTHPHRRGHLGRALCRAVEDPSVEIHSHRRRIRCARTVDPDVAQPAAKWRCIHSAGLSQGLATIHVLRRFGLMPLQYHGSTFKVALFDRWLVVVSGSKMVDELRSRPDNEVSFLDGVEDLLHMKYIVGHEALNDQYHIGIIKEKLTRMLPVVIPDVVEELTLAVPNFIPTKGDEWTAVNVVSTMQKIVARVSNRAFVGLPLCHNQEFMELAIRFTVDVIKDTLIVDITPSFLKTFVGQLLSSARRTMRQAMQHIQPAINERKADMKAFGKDWSDKPNDVLQWVIDEAVRRNHADVNIVERMFLVNFAAIHTSSNSLAHVLYDLAARPEWIEQLREEVEAVVGTDGWTKAALDKMRKLDSALKESSRYHGISLIALPRKVVKNITLNDGTLIPKGTVIAAAARAAHHDESNYVNADVFDPFRFSKLREREGESSKHQFVKTSADFVSFGHGKHACPGRFFAASVLKALLAYIILNYDMKLGGDGKRPANLSFSVHIIPSPTGRVLFRKRRLAECTTRETLS